MPVAHSKPMVKPVCLCSIYIVSEPFKLCKMRGVVRARVCVQGLVFTKVRSNLLSYFMHTKLHFIGSIVLYKKNIHIYVEKNKFNKRVW